MNSLWNDKSSTLVPVIPELGITPFSRNSFFDRLFGDSNLYPNNFPKKTSREDGSVAMEFNFAGFTPEEIKVSMDTVMHQIVINAKSEKDNSIRESSNSISLSPYTKAEDISTSLKNGILEIVISPNDKRDNDSLVELPINVA
jgi:HSP20 family molecular chaperone IbpA